MFALIEKKKIIFLKLFPPLHLVMPFLLWLICLSGTHTHMHLSYSALTPEVCEVVEACESRHTGRTVSLHLDRYVCVCLSVRARVLVYVSVTRRGSGKRLWWYFLCTQGIWAIFTHGPRGPCLHTVGTFIIKMHFKGHLHFFNHRNFAKKFNFGRLMSDMDKSKLCVLGGFWLIFVHKPALDAETSGLFFRQHHSRKGPHTYPQKESENLRGCWWARTKRVRSI